MHGAWLRALHLFSGFLILPVAHRYWWPKSVPLPEERLRDELLDAPIVSGLMACITSGDDARGACWRGSGAYPGAQNADGQCRPARMIAPRASEVLPSLPLLVLHWLRITQPEN
jgi:hypothetical protein